MVSRLDELDRELLRLAVPAFAALLSYPLYALVDAAIVGNLGREALAGVGAAGTVLITLVALFFFLAVGTTSSVARLLGAGNVREAEQAGVEGVWLGVISGTVLGLALAALARPLVSLFTDDNEVLHLGVLYLRLSTLGIPAWLATSAAFGVDRGRSDTRTPLFYGIIGVLINLVLEVWLIVGLGYGVGASALTTVVVQWIIGIAVVVRLARRALRSGASLRPGWRPLAALARTSLAMVVRTGALRGVFVVAAFIAGRTSTTALGAHEIAYQVWAAAALGLDAIETAGQTMIAKRLGAKSRAAARDVGIRAIRWSAGLGVLTGVIIVAAAPLIAAGFSDDGAVESVAMRALLVVGLMQPLCGVVFALDGVMFGASEWPFLARQMPLAATVFVAAATPVVITRAGLTWLWIALCVFMAARAVISYVHFRSPRWAVSDV